MGKALNQSISTFYGLHHEKGKSYTFEHFKKAAHKSRIYRIMKHFDERGHCNRQAGSGRPEKPIIKMFENLKEKIRKADEFGLRSLN